MHEPLSEKSYQLTKYRGWDKKTILHIIIFVCVK